MMSSNITKGVEFTDTHKQNKGTTEKWKHLYRFYFQNNTKLKETELTNNNSSNNEEEKFTHQKKKKNEECYPLYQQSIDLNHHIITQQFKLASLT